MFSCLLSFGGGGVGGVKLGVGGGEGQLRGFILYREEAPPLPLLPPVCNISRLKDAWTCLQTVYFLVP